MMTTTDLARLGAKVRLTELLSEAAQLRQTFPELATPEVAAPVTRATRRRRHLTSTQRRAISRRMKKFWAARRKAN